MQIFFREIDYLYSSNPHVFQNNDKTTNSMSIMPKMLLKQQKSSQLLEIMSQLPKDVGKY